MALHFDILSWFEVIMKVIWILEGESLKPSGLNDR